MTAYLNVAQLEHQRRKRLLTVLRQVSQEASERWPQLTKSNVRAINAYHFRRLAELLPESAEDGL